MHQHAFIRAAADQAIVYIATRLDSFLHKDVDFVIVSGDKAFEEVAALLNQSERSARVLRGEFLFFPHLVWSLSHYTRARPSDCPEEALLRQAIDHVLVNTQTASQFLQALRHLFPPGLLDQHWVTPAMLLGELDARGYVSCRGQGLLAECGYAHGGPGDTVVDVCSSLVREFAASRALNVSRFWKRGAGSSLNGFEAVSTVALTSDGLLIAVGDVDGQIYVTSADSNASVAGNEVYCHAGKVTGLVWLLDTPMLLSCGLDGRLMLHTLLVPRQSESRVWTSKQIASLLPDRITSLALLEGNIIAAGTLDRGVCLCHLDGSSQSWLNCGKSVVELVCSKNVLFVLSKNQMSRWEDGESVWISNLRDPAACLSLSNRFGTILVGTRNGLVLMFSAADGSHKGELAHSLGHVRSLCTSPSGLFAVCAADRVLAWSLASQRCVLSERASAITSISVSERKDSPLLVALGSYDGHVHLIPNHEALRCIAEEPPASRLDALTVLSTKLRQFRRSQQLSSDEQQIQQVRNPSRNYEMESLIALLFQRAVQDQTMPKTTVGLLSFVRQCQSEKKWRSSKFGAEQVAQYLVEHFVDEMEEGRVIWDVPKLSRPWAGDY